MIIVANSFQGIPLADNSVQCVVTSPPYWGLRNYGVQGQLGQEPKLEAYVTNLVHVFREVHRILRNDGTLWLNLGDCFLRKNLLGIPWRVAFALQEDGWFLRSDIIWSKPNCMSESVKDRPTCSHEYLFLLTKSPRYFYDAEAIAEPAVSTDVRKFVDASSDKQRGHSRRHAGFNGRYAERLRTQGLPTTRNKRSVWSVAVRPSPDPDHFATFPPNLITPCILAGSRIGDTVLDPFSGSGTVVLVATGNSRRGIGLELNKAYATRSRQRMGLVV